MVSMSLYKLEEYLQELIDTEPIVEGEGYRFAIIKEIVSTDAEVKDKRDSWARLLKSLRHTYEGKRAEAKVLYEEARVLEDRYKRLTGDMVNLIDHFIPDPDPSIKNPKPKAVHGNRFTLKVVKNAPSLEVTAELPECWTDVTIEHLPHDVWKGIVDLVADMLAATEDPTGFRRRMSGYVKSIDPANARIREALERGDEIPGAKMVQKKRLDIK